MEKEIDTLQNVANIASEFAITYGFQILGALIILLIGWQVSKWIAGLVMRLCGRLKLDVTLSRFFAGVAKTTVLVFVVIIALGKFGITITPLVAALGAVAFGSTLALQGPLSNYGSGFTIILTRPFVVGDTIRIQGVIGVVEEIKLSCTQLINEDGERITIPNNRIVGEVLHNSFANLVVEQTITISYEDDAQRAISLIRDVLDRNSEVTRDPAPQVGIEKFAESGIAVGLRYWVPTRKYFQAMYAVNGEIHQAMTAAGIRIPAPRQRIDLKRE